MLKRVRGIYGVALLALMLGICLSACASAQHTTSICPCSPIGPGVWQERPNQGVASGPAGAFALRMIEITPQQFRFYYVFKSASHASLHVIVSSVLPESPTTPAITLAATVQALGQIGAYTIGVIHVTRNNRSGQFVTLAITPSVAGAATWQLAPLQQRFPAPPPRHTRIGMWVTPEGLPEAQWLGPVTEQEVTYLIYVKVVIPGQPVADRTYVFFQYDDPVVVKALTKAQYIAIAGSANFTP